MLTLFVLYKSSVLKPSYYMIVGFILVEPGFILLIKPILTT